MGHKNDNGEDSIVNSHTLLSMTSAQKAALLLKMQREHILCQKQATLEKNYLDPLTHLSNREYFFSKAFTVLKSRFNREHTKSILILVNISDFKSINQRYGIQEGDECLKETGLRLLEGIERFKGDVSISRIGSDEFALLFASLDIPTHAKLTEYAQSIIDDILQKFKSPMELSGTNVDISVNMGISYFHSKDQNIDAMIQEASLALEAAKKDSKRSFYFFEPVLDKEAKFKASLMQQFSSEAEKRILLFYQPIMDVQSNIKGYEILSRWRKNNHTIIPAVEFIHHFEENGMIVAFDRYILEEVCKQINIWEKENDTNKEEEKYTFWINISPMSFMNEDFLLFVPKILEKYTIDPSRIIFEITESRILDNFEVVAQRLQLLAEYGIQFALDDFGTGYSSLSYLSTLPLKQLKIDRTLIRDIASNTKNRKVVSMIILMAKTIGLEVVAEGVENMAQKNILQKLGCEYMQGYLFDSPTLPEYYEYAEGL